MLIPQKLFTLIDSIPDNILNRLLKDVDHLIAKQTKGVTGKQGFLMLMRAGDNTVLAAIYKVLEAPLMVAGCVGGPIGFAVNIVDAIFCFALGNMFGFCIDVISAFCMVPGAKGVLKIGEGATKIIVSLIMENAKRCKSLDVFKAVVARVMSFNMKASEFIPELYNFYRNELRCSKALLDDILGWIWMHYQKAFNILEQRLKNVSPKPQVQPSLPSNNPQSIMHKTAGADKRIKFGELTVGKTMQNGQLKQYRDLNYGTQNYYINFNPLHF